jgi:aminoglycoside 6'-N-acetyltransferase I
MRLSAAAVIVDVPGDPEVIGRIAELLVEGFSDTGSAAWKTLDEAIADVAESLQPGRISRMAVDDAGEVLGWIGGLEAYEGNVWELHPLVVRRDRRREGIGRQLVADLEAQVAMRGGHTVLLGTDDENGRTSLGGVDVYPDVLSKLQAIANRAGHPFEFYRRLGYEIVGMVPDANGFGKPDILMAKRVAP